MSIKVIGLGMGRTGTSSLKLALGKLGYGSCYHMEDLIKKPTEVQFWNEIDRHGQTDWNLLFRNYQSAVDFPTIGYYREILRAYPEAKVILTVRDEESWYQSASQTILNAEPGFLEKFKMSFRLPFSPRLRYLLQVFKLSKKFWLKNVAQTTRIKKKQSVFTASGIYKLSRKSKKQIYWFIMLRKDGRPCVNF